MCYFTKPEIVHLNYRLQMIRLYKDARIFMHKRVGIPKKTATWQHTASQTDAWSLPRLLSGFGVEVHLNLAWIAVSGGEPLLPSFEIRASPIACRYGLHYEQLHSVPW